MRSRGKPTPLIAFVAAAVSLVLIFVWIASAWVTFIVWPTDGSWNGITAGHLFFHGEGQRTNAFEWYLGRTDEPFRWGFSYYRYGPVYGIDVPLWLLATISLTVTVIAWRMGATSRMRRLLGRCVQCGYDRAGLAPSATCPECGLCPAELLNTHHTT